MPVELAPLVAPPSGAAEGRPLLAEVALTPPSPSPPSSAGFVFSASEHELNQTNNKAELTISLDFTDMTGLAVVRGLARPERHQTSAASLN